MLATCAADSDRQFGPRVAINCRAFDFTLLFEDVALTLIPTSLFIFSLLVRLRGIRRAPVKAISYKLAAYKLFLLATLFMTHVGYAAVRIKSSALRTPVSLASDVLNIVATAGAAILSFLEDQRSIRPSDIIIVYFSSLALLWIPRVRSVWLIPASRACRGLWTTIYIITVLIAILESTNKVKNLRPAYKHVTVEQVSGLWSRSLFIWVVPFIRTGYSTIFSVGDMPEVDESLQGDQTYDKLNKAWMQSTGKYRLIKAVSRAYAGSALSGIVPRLLLSGFTFCQPFLITATVDFFTGDGKESPNEYGKALVGAFLLVYLGIAISTAVYWRQTLRLCTMVRAGLISSLYLKATVLPGEDAEGNAVLTLMGTDVERIVNSLRSLHEIWASIIEVVIALYLLQRQVYLACLVPAIISLACVFGAGPVSTRTAPAQKAWVERVEERVAVTSSMLRDMKEVKMLGLVDVFFRLITKLRVEELKVSSRFRKLFIWMVLLSNIPMDLAPYATFAVYAIIAVVRNDGSLGASQAFTSLSLISLMTSPLLEFVQAAPSFIQSLGCFERIEVYLNKTLIMRSSCERQVTRHSAPTEGPESTGANHDHAGCLDKLTLGDTVVSFQNADIGWSSNLEAVLQNLSLDIGMGITMITGPVGSGKSALIKSILGEMTVEKGAIHTTFKNFAYCPQVPWVVDDTIQYNITGGTEFDAEWYDFAVSACGLKDDFRFISGGDMHITGSGGASLSGGQKQRVSLARAIYSRLPVFLLDDIFNGLDGKRLRHISASLFDQHGYFRTAAKAVILATHTESLLSYADHIIVLERGEVAYSGSYEGLMDRTHDAALNNLTSLQEGHNGDLYPSNTLARKSICNEAENDVTYNGQMKGTLDMSRRDGSWEVYRYYTRSAGVWITMLFIISFIVSTFLSTFSTLWIQWWSESNVREPNGRIGWYLGFYTAFTVVGILSFFVGCYLLFIHIINDTALTFHTDLLNATLNAPWSFFQMTDAGTLTNRFSQDMDLIDMKLPLWVVNTVANVALTFMKLVLLCAVGKYMAVTFPFLVATFIIIQSVYLRTSRQVRLLDIEAKAPLYSHFMETVDGVSSIRAFGWQGNFRTECSRRLNESQRPFYMLLCLQQWLTLVLDLVIAAMAVVLVAIATSLRDQFSAGGMGVALNLVLSFNQILVHTIQSWTQLETSIGAVARVDGFRKDTPSEGKGSDPLSTSQDWKIEGAVDFENLTAAHQSADRQPVLKNLTLRIKPGEKIAVCGPSGSGKTSLVMTLLHMTEIRSGSVSIDKRDLASIQPSDIRRRLSVIPQDPYFLPGTIRLNLDPHALSTDDEIIQAVEKVGLRRLIQRIGGLDGDLKGSEWSMGERQLLALARALISRSPILLLDEATSNVDRETESIIQDVVETEFRNHTVISVMHRLRYITRFDRVALIRNGELVECDPPSALLARDSEFREFFTAFGGSP